MKLIRLSSALHSIFNRFRLAGMGFGRSIVIYSLIAAISCSPFAAAADLCAEPDADSVEAQSVSQVSSAHHHGSATEEQAEDTECPSCDDCVVACVFSACNPAAIEFFSLQDIGDRPSRFDLVVTSSHDGPVLYPPFRPPIQLQ